MYIPFHRQQFRPVAFLITYATMQSLTFSSDTIKHIQFRIRITQIKKYAPSVARGSTITFKSIRSKSVPTVKIHNCLT